MHKIKSISKIGLVVLGLGVCVLLTAGTTLAQKVTVDFDRDIDFSKYKSYAFVEGTETLQTLTN